jgi:hypothetical protein
MNKKVIFIMTLVFALVNAEAFCGFYVAKAGADLYNNKSEVILVRDGDNTTITMSNDFKGKVKDFAMVVPVPNVLKREDITVVERSIFSMLDAYSSPRLVEYFDQNPCSPPPPKLVYMVEDEVAESTVSRSIGFVKKEKDYKVKIEAKYNVEEYEILVLSAKESDGLKRWLVDNGYKIPPKAEKVLAPYIKNKLKFFVVKVNLQKYNPGKNGGYLRPLQIKVKSDKFMLPIRLGMANSRGEQDMIVYAFTKSGRVECTNYRTVKAPTDRNVPTFVKPNFGTFYKDLFRNAHSREGRNAVFLEYAWNVTPSWGGQKCDPCVGNPPYFTDLTKAGVSWSSNTRLPVFFTRMHVRYSIDKFPEDLFFQVTPNREHFQARYVLHHPARGSVDCAEGVKYMKKLRNRRKLEMQELAALTQWDVNMFYDYVKNGTDLVKQDEENDQNSIVPAGKSNKPGGGFGTTILFGLGLTCLLLFSGVQLYARRLSK